MKTKIAVLCLVALCARGDSGGGDTRLAAVAESLEGSAREFGLFAAIFPDVEIKRYAQGRADAYKDAAVRVRELMDREAVGSTRVPRGLPLEETP